MTRLDIHSIQKIFQKRLPDSHKGNHGHSLIIAGSKTKMGAAIICTKACLRAGAGLVTVSIPGKERESVFTTVPEAMIAFRKEKKNWEAYNSFGIGPGIGTDNQAEKLLKLMIANVKLPAVFDADALNIMAKEQELLKKLPPNPLLPHILKSLTDCSEIIIPKQTEDKPQ